ncbi:MAG: TIGR01620 family protein [Pseudomonadota bacterium]
MSDAEGNKRKPRAFKVDDPALDPVSDAFDERASPPSEREDDVDGVYRLPDKADIAEGIRWGSLFFAAMFGLIGLGLSMWFGHLISAALASDGFIGWLSTSLLVLLLVAGVVLVFRELIGVFRLRKLERVRERADKALRTQDLDLERETAVDIARLFRGRSDVAWHVAQFSEHAQDVRDPGELLTLADRDLLAPLDQRARRIVLSSSKRVAIVTALSPMLLIDVAYVFVENIRMLREVATLYGGRPGLLGALRLGRMVLTNLIAAGGLALTDDLLGQFLGQDLLRRVSSRLGEGAFNGALTARVGVAAIEVIRPLPNVVTKPVRVRGIMSELFKSEPKSDDKSDHMDADPPSR